MSNHLVAFHMSVFLLRRVRRIAAPFLVKFGYKSLIKPYQRAGRLNNSQLYVGQCQFEKKEELFIVIVQGHYEHAAR